jgi:hypothetical protein
MEGAPITFVVFGPEDANRTLILLRLETEIPEVIGREVVVRKELVVKHSARSLFYYRHQGQSL